MKKFFCAAKRELKERVLKFEAFEGLYLIPFGAILIYCGKYEPEFAIQRVCILGGWYIISIGLWKIYFNPIKKKYRERRQLRERIVDARFSAPADQPPKK